MIIEVNCNNDSLSIDGKLTPFKIEDPYLLIAILAAIFDKLDDESPNSLEIDLVKIDKNKLTVINGW